MEWFIVHTKYNHENKVFKNLVNMGFKIFYPKLLKKKKIRSSIKEITVPLFPCYIFVLLDPKNDEWQKINYTQGVIRILSTDKKNPSSVSMIFMDNLLSVCDKNSVLTHKYFNFKIGQKVKFVDGPFLNKFARIIGLPSRERISILFESFSSKVRVLALKKTVIPV